MTTATTDKALIAHLLRRAGFGATFEEIEKYAELGYEETVEHLLHPERTPDIEEDLLERYYIDWKESRNIEGALVETVYRFNARAGVRPLQEKIALFWHHVFATGLAKVLHEKTILNQMDMCLRHGLDSYRDLLVYLARDPAMIFWLDNNVNHKDAINENWGRELLELFSMGIGMDGHDNYTEEDVKEVARAFTGWTMDDDNTASIPFGKMPWLFRFDSDDHDYGEKTVLGETGNFTGEEVIDVIAKQPSTARFICRHLYNFFVADEVPVPSWRDPPPLHPEAISPMEDAASASNIPCGSSLILPSLSLTRYRFSSTTLALSVITAGTNSVSELSAAPPIPRTVAASVTSWIRPRSFSAASISVVAATASFWLCPLRSISVLIRESCYLKLGAVMGYGSRTAGNTVGEQGGGGWHTACRRWRRGPY